MLAGAEYEKIIESISKRIIELNGYPKNNPANHQYEFFNDNKKVEPYQFRTFIHGNEDRIGRVNAIVYIGISNLPYKSNDQKIYDDSIIEGDLIYKAVKEILREVIGIAINYENDITQIIVPQGAEEVVTSLTNLVYNVINCLNRKCRKHLNELSADKKIYCYDVNVGLKRESFKMHLEIGADTNINLIYNHSPKLKESALEAMG